MGEIPQQAVPNGDGSWVAIVSDVVKDLLQQQIPGSVVILIVAVILVPMGFRSWLRHRKGK